MAVMFSEKINPDKLEEKVIKLNRVAKVVKGGRRFSFAALVVVGDRNGHVGLGYGKAGEVPEAIRKGTEDAKKNLISVKLQNSTIPHKTTQRYRGAKILLMPASEGSGIIAGSAVRAVVEFAGIRDILSKRLGSSNQINIAKATFEALRNMMSLQSVAERRGKRVRDFLVGYNGTVPAETEETVAVEEDAPVASGVEV
jgi:small subunit ribosomal protein S5